MTSSSSHFSTKLPCFHGTPFVLLSKLEERFEMKYMYCLAAALILTTSVLADQRQSFGSANSPLSQDLRRSQGQAKTVLKKYTLAKNSDHTSESALPISSTLHSQTLKSAISVFVGTVLTFVLNNVYSLGPVQASSITSLFVSLVLPEKLAIAAACGSFAGMARTAVIGGLHDSLLLGIICAAMMKLFDQKTWLVGVGGRLGFIAQCACTTQFIITSLIRVPSESAKLIGNYPSVDRLLLDLPSVCAFTVCGAVFMKLWKDIFADQGKKTNNLKIVYNKLSTTVAAVGATGLIATLLSPASVAGPIFCGSFVAMSSPAKLGSFGALIGASILAGLSNQLLAGALLGGWGGKLGTSSLVGVVLYTILSDVTDKVSTATRPTKPTTATPGYRGMQPLSS